DAIAVIAGADVVLVRGALSNSRHERLPDAGPIASRPHRMGILVPAVEVADHGDVLGVRCPHREANAGRTVDDGRMRAEDPIEPRVGTLAEIVDVALVDLAVSARRPPGAAGRV